MAHVGCARVHVDANKLVLEAVFAFRLPSLFFNLATLLQFFLSQGLQLFFLLERISDGTFALLLLLLQSVLFAHDLEEAVGFEVEDLRELAKRVHLVCLKRLEVETNTLQVNNKNVGSLRNERTLAKIDLSIAAVTVVIVDDFTFDLLLKRLVHSLDVLDV